MAKKAKATQAPEPQNETLIVPRLEAVREATEELATATELLELVRRMDIRSAADYQFSGGALKEVAQKHDQVQERRDTKAEPFKAAVKAITDTFRPVVDAYKECERLAKEKLGDWAALQEQQRSKLLLDASAAFSAGKNDHGKTLVKKAEGTEVPKLDGVSVSMKWTGEVIDAEALRKAVLEGKVSSEALMPNVDVLLALTEAKLGDPEIPGWRAFPRAQVRTSRKG